DPHALARVVEACAAVMGEQLMLVDVPAIARPLPKRRSARNVIARRFLAQFDAGGQPVTFANLTWALEFADVAIDALYDAGLHVTTHVCRTCERCDIRAVRDDVA